RKPFPYVTGPGDQLYAQFSPDGRWVTYVSTETGRNEVYVAPFPWTGAKWQVSPGNAVLPRWRRQDELYFMNDGTSRLTVAKVNGRGANFEVIDTETLFDADNVSPSISSGQYDATADGQRFIVITTGKTGILPLTVVQNWTEELKA